MSERLVVLQAPHSYNFNLGLLFISFSFDLRMFVIQLI